MDGVPAWERPRRVASSMWCDCECTVIFAPLPLPVCLFLLLRVSRIGTTRRLGCWTTTRALWKNLESYKWRCFQGLALSSMGHLNDQRRGAIFLYVGVLERVRSHAMQYTRVFFDGHCKLHFHTHSRMRKRSHAQAHNMNAQYVGNTRENTELSVQ